MIIIVCPLNQMIQGLCQEICIFSSGKVFFCGLSVGIETVSQKIHLPEIFGIIKLELKQQENLSSLVAGINSVIRLETFQGWQARCVLLKIHQTGSLII